MGRRSDTTAFLFFFWDRAHVAQLFIRGLSWVSLLLPLIVLGLQACAPTPSWCNAGGLTQGPRHARQAVYLPVEYLYSLALNTVLFVYSYCLDMQMQSLYVLWNYGKGQGFLRVWKACCFHCRRKKWPEFTMTVHFVWELWEKTLCESPLCPSLPPCFLSFLIALLSHSADALSHSAEAQHWAESWGSKCKPHKGLSLRMLLF